MFCVSVGEMKVHFQMLKQVGSLDLWSQISKKIDLAL